MVIRKVKKYIVKKEKIIRHVSAFRREFSKHLTTFITGAFAFVAALLWRDAIVSFLDRYQNLIKELMPLKEIWVAQISTALAVTVIAVVVIIAVSKLLKVEE